MTVFENVPPQAVPIMLDQLRAHGATVDMEAGRIETISGVVIFRHSGNRLEVRITEDRGHFPKKLLIGGMRQFVQEAVERVRWA